MQLAQDQTTSIQVRASACNVLALMANRRPSVVAELKLDKPDEGACTLEVLKVHSAVLRGLVLKVPCLHQHIARDRCRRETARLVCWPLLCWILPASS